MNKRLAWGTMTFLAMGIVLVASRYFSLNPSVFFPQQRDVYLAHQSAIILHIAGGVLALAFGPFQFLNRLRNRRPKIHRWMGRIYLIGIMLGGTAGLYMAMFAFAGLVARFGFGSLAVLWLTTGWMAYRTIRAGHVAAHRRWMIRNFALTFAAVTLRLEMFPLTILFGEILGYQIVAWSCWTLNLIAAEGLLRGWFHRQALRQAVQATGD